MTVGIDLKRIYDEDYYFWYSENARLLREKKFNEIDIENLAEELESMGRHERDKLESFLIILFLHILKLKYQSNYEAGLRSWKISVKEHRLRANRHLQNNPSLKGILSSIVLDAYSIARLEAAQETGLTEETFPLEMPFTGELALTEDWLPTE